MARPHEKLEAWRQAMQLVKVVYSATRSFPKEEIFGLTCQMRRSAISVPCNIAEGSAWSGRRELAQFLNIAKGSLSELETQSLIAVELGFLDASHEVFQTLERVARLVTGFHRKAAGPT